MVVLEDLRQIVGDRVTASPTELYCYPLMHLLVGGMPDYVVRPKSTTEVAQILCLASEFEVSVTAEAQELDLLEGPCRSREASS